MKLEYIALDKLSISAANMRCGKKAPDIADILPSVRARGVLVPLLVRPNCADGHYEIVAGRRRYHCAQTLAADTGEVGELPCAIMDGDEGTDDAAALEASLIENVARADPDEVTRWTSFVRLVKEGRSVEEIASTFGLPELAVRRTLALGNLLPRIRDLYARQEVDAASIRHLTLASKAQQKAWLALRDDPDACLPRGHQLKAWLFGGQSIATGVALFDMGCFTGPIVADLFGEGGYFVDCDQFWTAQNAEIEARRDAYIAAGWSDVVIVPPDTHFHSWEYEKTPKRKGGRIYVDVRANGEVTFHEGYLSRTEAQRRERANNGSGEVARATRPEISGNMQTYVDLHRHAAVRATLLDAPALALRLMVAHVLLSAGHWHVRTDPRLSRNDSVQASADEAPAEAVFDAKRRAVLALLDMDAETPNVAGSHGGEHDLARLFTVLAALSDDDFLAVVAVVMGETLACGSAIVDLLGHRLNVDMAAWWEADQAFFDGVRDREVLTRMLAEIGGETVASAHADAKGKLIKSVITDHLNGENGRNRVEKWVPRWMAFPPSAYTPRGGVGTVASHATIADLIGDGDAPDAGKEAAVPTGSGDGDAPPDDAPDHAIAA
ncbi:chromosome partitioning protein ParB [Sphingomonas sp. DBB INV C78]|uniref:ParB/RepB/Spo0J family partition protein n=1 Tax=Sphingomonas sp. DBB INV C78 TaxID=3349434 RepID=UPI0036D271FB